MAWIEHLFEHVTYGVSLGLEAMAVVLISVGALRAVLLLVKPVFGAAKFPDASRAAFLELASWLLVALEFTLASDVVRSAIAPSWEEIGQLAAVAVIRTFLNYFLTRDLEHGRQELQDAHAATLQAD